MAFSIRVTNEMKKHLTVAEMPDVRKIQQEFKNAENEEFELVDYCKMIAGLFGEHNSKIFEPRAEIAKNSRTNNRFSDTSNDLDVWIECYIFGNEICGEFGAYITDLWDISEDNQDEIRSHIFKNIFKRVC